MKAIGDTSWYPPQAENRIGAMVKTRPDWVLSRQRAWGVPLAIFVDKKTARSSTTRTSTRASPTPSAQEGADAWFNSPPSRFLGNDRNPDDYEQVKDILDVWFDSGSTHVFTVENPIEPSWPKADHADLYLEGSDQHRGWFQSSLLESCGTRGRAPYDAVLTHGFVLDEQGRKMSKSLGNTVAAADDRRQERRRHSAPVGGEFGFHRRPAHRPGHHQGQCRCLSPPAQHDPLHARQSRRLRRRASASLMPQMPELERYMLAKLAELDATLRAGYAEFDFNRVFSALFNFCTNELSAFYFDIRKDALYCDPRGRTAPARRAHRARRNLPPRRDLARADPVFHDGRGVAAALSRRATKACICRLFPETPADWANPDLIEKWNRIRALRRVVTGALEIARRDKMIGASLEAAPAALCSATRADAALFDDVDLAEIAITSAAQVSKWARGRQTRSGLPTFRALRPSSSGRMAENARAAGWSCRKWERCRHDRSLPALRGCGGGAGRSST